MSQYQQNRNVLLAIGGGLSLAIILFLYPLPITQLLLALHIPIGTAQNLAWVILLLSLAALKSCWKKNGKKTFLTLIIAVLLGTTGGQILIVTARLNNWCDDSSNLDRLIEACTTIIKSGDAKAGQYNNRGVAYNRKGLRDLAMRDLDRAVALDPYGAAAFNNRGGVYLMEGLYDSAITDLDHALRINPNCAAALANRGAAYLGKADNTQAMKDLSEAIRLDPENFKSYVYRASTYLNAGMYSEAIKDSDTAIRLDSSNWTAFFLRGLAEFYTDPVSAAKDLAATMGKQNDKAEVVLWLHLARLRAGQHDEQEFERNAAMPPAAQWPAPVIALYRGKSTADVVLAKANNGKPDERRDQTCVAYFFIGKWYAQQHENEKARESFQTATDICQRGTFDMLATQTEMKSLSTTVEYRLSRAELGKLESLPNDQTFDDYIKNDPFISNAINRVVLASIDPGLMDREVWLDYFTEAARQSKRLHSDITNENYLFGWTFQRHAGFHNYFFIVNLKSGAVALASSTPSQITLMYNKCTEPAFTRRVNFLIRKWLYDSARDSDEHAFSSDFYIDDPSAQLNSPAILRERSFGICHE